MMKEKVVILFLKSPEKGVVKTRLAKALGEDLTLELYQCFIADILKTGKKIAADIFIIYSAINGVNGEGFYLDNEYPCLPQKGVDLGIRMYNAFQAVSAQGYKKIVLIGSDTPDLPAAYIDEAFFRLDKYDVVLGPSDDGGYYLIALRQDTINDAIFNDLPWSTSQVFSKTMKIVGQRGMAHYTLPKWDDIDEIDDLRRFYDHHKRKGETSRTMAFLSKIEKLWIKGFEDEAKKRSQPWKIEISFFA